VASLQDGQMGRLRRKAFATYTCQHSGEICAGTGNDPNILVAKHRIPHHGNPALFWERNHDSPAQEEGVQGRAGRQKASRAVDDARSETLRSQRDIGSVLESVDTPGTLQVLGATIDGTRSYRRDRKNHWRRWHSAGSSERYIVTDVPLPRCPHRLDL